jgi:hypothetical protein
MGREGQFPLAIHVSSLVINITNGIVEARIREL